MPSFSVVCMSVTFYFGMNVLWDDINQIFKDGLGWIALNVLSHILTYFCRLFKNCSVTFSLFLHRASHASVTFYFGMNVLWDDINQIFKDGFGWIALNVLSHILTYFCRLFKNCSVTFSLFLHIASHEGYEQTYVCLNRSKVPFSRLEKSDLACFRIFIYVIQ